MIRESLYFSFAGRRSTDFGILNVAVADGLYEEQFLANRSIVEKTIRGRDKPYLIEVKRDTKSFQLSFAFEETWNDDLIREVARWLDVDYYEPLFFSENIDIVYYVMPVDNSFLIHNGLKQGYMTLTMRCDSPYGYSPQLATQLYNCTGNSGVNTIEFDNLGDNEIQPEIYIQKVDSGELSIINLSKANSEFKFTGLNHNEELYVDCENETIESSLPTYRYDNFNDNYLSIPYGKNILQINGKCKIKFQYHYKFK